MYRMGHKHAKRGESNIVNTHRGNPITGAMRLVANYPKLSLHEQCKIGQFGHPKPTGLMFVYRTGSIENLMKPIMYIKRHSNVYTCTTSLDGDKLYACSSLSAMLKFIDEYISQTQR